MKTRFSRLRHRWQTGDTIVEVLIVLSVLSLAFAYSYATANKGLNQARNAQEHSQALGKLDSQVEMLRTAFAKDTLKDPPDKPFCLYYEGGELKIEKFVAFTPSADPDADKVDGSEGTGPSDPGDQYPDKCVTDDLYHASIVYDDAAGNADQSYYKLRIRWLGVGGLHNQQEEFVYKVQPLSNEHVDYGDSPLPVPDLHPILTLNQTGSGTDYSFTWTINDPSFGAGGPMTEECSYDSGPWLPCAQPQTRSSAADPPNSQHTFTARARNVLGSGEDSFTWNNPVPPPAKPAQPRLAGSAPGEMRIPNCWYGEPACGNWVDVYVSGVPNALAEIYTYNYDNGSSYISSVRLDGAGNGSARVGVFTYRRTSPGDGHYNTFIMQARQQDSQSGLWSDWTGRIEGRSNGDTACCDANGWYVFLWRTVMDVPRWP